MALEEAPFDLECLIEDVLGLMSFKAREKSLELATWYPHGAPRRFWGDAGRLRQIFMNLLSNAVKFTQSGYVLAEVEASEPVNGQSSVRIAIHDTGIGISLESQSRLFDRFTQADQTIAGRFGGSGLGLSIVKQVVELMGGKVGVMSKEGAGSTFYCQIPLRVDQETLTTPLQDECLSGVTVLVTGGQFTGRFVISEWCQRWGMRTEHCDLPNLSTFLEAAAHGERPFQFVIVDGSIATLSEGLHQVRLGDTEHLPKVILITSDPWGRAKDLTADALLSTPVRANVLREKLIELVHGAPSQSSFRSGGPSPVAGKFGLGKVLVIDDNLINQKLACALLRRLGCEVDTADDGAGGVKKVSESEYGLVFMDCVMPEMDGFAATVAIRQLASKSATVPIIALTASATTEDREHCLAVGMNDFIAKPIRSEQLSQCLVKWLHKT